MIGNDADLPTPARIVNWASRKERERERESVEENDDAKEK
jgi:hypothetical protein